MLYLKTKKKSLKQNLLAKLKPLKKEKPFT